MSRNGQWDLIVAIDERVVHRFANDFWASDKVQNPLQEWRSFKSQLELPPTPYHLNAAVSLDFIDQGDAEWLRIKLAATGAEHLVAEVSFKLRCAAKCQLYSKLNESGSASAGTFLDVQADAEITISAESALEGAGTPEERFVLSFRNFQVLRFGLVGDDNLPPAARTILEKIVKPRLSALFGGLKPFPLSPLKEMLIDKAQDRRLRVETEFRFASFPTANPAQPYVGLEDARADANRNTVIMVAAAFAFKEGPPGEYPFPNPSPRPLTELVIPVSDERPGAILCSQRLLTYLNTFVVPKQIKNFWEKEMGEAVENKGLYRFMLHPDTNKPIAVDNSSDETISIDSVGPSRILRSEVELKMQFHVCKSGFLFFGAPDPNYEAVLRTSYGADSEEKRLVTKNQRVVGFRNTDGWFKRLVGGIISGLFDAFDAVMNLLRGNFKQALISFLWALGQYFGVILYLVIGFIVVYVIDPEISEQDLLDQPFKIPWSDDKHSLLHYVGDADFFDGVNADADANPWASMAVYFRAVKP